MGKITLKPTSNSKLKYEMKIDITPSWTIGDLLVNLNQYRSPSEQLRDILNHKMETLSNNYLLSKAANDFPFLYVN